jgi:hypothetical protein
MAPAATFKKLPPNATVEMMVFAYHEAMHAYMGMAAENATLAAECREHMRQRDQALEVVSAEVVVLGAAVRHVTGRVSAIEMKLAAPGAPKPTPADPPPALASPPMRDEDTSWHDYDAEWEEARKLLHAQVRDPGNPMTSDRARAISTEVVQALEQGRELSTWRLIKSGPKYLFRKAVDALIPLLVGGGAVYLWHWLSKR